MVIEKNFLASVQRAQEHKGIAIYLCNWKDFLSIYLRSQPFHFMKEESKGETECFYLICRHKRVGGKETSVIKHKSFRENSNSFCFLGH